MRRTTTTTAVAVLVASSALVLAGCGNVVEDTINNAVEEGVERAIEGDSGEDVNIDVGVDGSVSVPADFPSGLPLPPGELRSALAVGNTWALDYIVDDAAVATDLNSWYESNGYEALTSADYGTLKQWMWQNGEYSVIVSLLEDGSTLTLSYSVTIPE